MDSTDPQAIGPYRLISRLGVGGMGRVYLARSAGGRTVAVKVVRPELAGDSEFRERFAREVAAARAVDGAYTAPVVDAEPDGALPWLATSYVLGPSLTDAVRDHGPLPEQSVRALGAGLAQALRAVHAAGLVHRDLKPSNVLLAADGPRVIDFGIARALDGDQMTRTGIVVGSPGYMCPEQAAGQPMGPAGDVFSLASVLLFAATGHGPFESESGPAAQLYRVIHDQPELAALPDGLRQAVAACLAKDPARRPTPEQLGAMLAPEGADAILRDGWLPVPVASAIARHAATVMDLETPTHGTAAGPSATAGTGSAYSPTRTDGVAVPFEGTMKLGAAPTTAALTTSDAPSNSRRRLLFAGGGLLALAAAGGAAWAIESGGSSKTADGPAKPAPGGSPGASSTGAAANSSANSAAGAQPLPSATQSRADGVPPQPLWTYNATGRLSSSPVVVSGGMVHPQGEALIGLDGATGKVVWSRPDVDATNAAASGGKVYVSAGNGAAGYDSAGGQPVWQSTTTDPSGNLISTDNLLGADDKAVYMFAAILPKGEITTTGTDGVVAFSIATKQQLWFQPRKKGTDPLVDSQAWGGNLYYTDDQENLVARSGQDGHQMWFAATGAKAAYPAAFDATQAYCLAEGRGLQAVRLTDGTQQWEIKVPAGEQRMFEPITVADGVVYGSDGTLTVGAWDVKTGNQLWSCPLPQRASWVSAPVVVQQTLFVPSNDGGGIYAVDTKQGKIRWNFTNGQNATSDWYLATDGQRLFAAYGGTIYALPPV
ncbi:serine/threonine-protein kinase [Kitasatospora sp. GAS204B]|uniref:serine/threonine-protein kinase n=1 Tax=Kitasatospora sp. GAS204B TaxID=3035283 RepID=UPI0024752242|nr:serine/threonine-protein kinase [Kitasatospora sp. GAS204B]